MMKSSIYKVKHVVKNEDPKYRIKKNERMACGTPRETKLTTESRRSVDFPTHWGFIQPAQYAVKHMLR